MQPFCNITVSSDVHRHIGAATGSCEQGPPQQHTLVPLVILLAQQMQIIASSHTSTQLKVIADLVDKCQQTLYQVRPGCCKFIGTFDIKDVIINDHCATSHQHEQYGCISDCIAFAAHYGAQQWTLQHGSERQTLPAVCSKDWAACAFHVTATTADDQQILTVAAVHQISEHVHAPERVCCPVATLQANGDQLWHSA